MCSVPPLPLYRGVGEGYSRCTGAGAAGHSSEAGVYAVKTEDSSQFFIMGHPEYDPDTLAREYRRDIDKGLDIAVPAHYFPEDDPARVPVVRLAQRGPIALYQLAELLPVPNDSIRLVKGALNGTPGRSFRFSRRALLRFHSDFCPDLTNNPHFAILIWTTLEKGGFRFASF